jgi:hypothetical protein
MRRKLTALSSSAQQTPMAFQGSSRVMSVGAPREIAAGSLFQNTNQKGENIMKRREFLQTAGAGLAASTTVAAPAIAQSMPELKWRCTTSWPKSLDVPFSASETISKYVAEATDNKFQIQAFAG